MKIIEIFLFPKRQYSVLELKLIESFAWWMQSNYFGKRFQFIICQMIYDIGIYFTFVCFLKIE